ELKSTQHELHSNLEQLESVNEDLRSINEEAASMNEELQSANEELETSKEELQSINEELTTVNNELENKVSELQLLNDDMTNLLVSTDIPTLFLDRDHRIRRATPAAARLFRVLPTDVGRSIADIKASVSDDRLLRDCQEVLRSLAPVEGQVATTDGRIYHRKIQPYRTSSDRIEGVVVTYNDITVPVRAAEQAREAQNYAEAIVETIREPLVVLDQSLVVQTANDAFFKIFDLVPARVLGLHFYDVGGGEWDIPELRDLLEHILPRENQLVDYEVRRNFEGVGSLVMCLNARVLNAGQRQLILIAMEDITIRIRAENTRNMVLREMVLYEEKERHRLALELHDETGQHVTAFLLGLASLKAAHDKPESRNLVAEMQTQAEELARQLHGISLQLRPMALDDHGLERALANYVEDVAMRQHLEVDLHTSGSGHGRLPSHVETALYRMTQEAITNVLKHGKATKASIVLAHKAREVSLIIEDDGVGFDTDAAPDGSRGNGSRIGLRGIRERVMLAGGTLTIESHPGKGAALYARIPLPAGNHEE
ncbi:MAG: PAS domain-containing protein, partial [Gemmatimonadota bacterium]